MTVDSDFKALVRARMAETGETYTVARAALVEERHRPDREYVDHVVRTFFDGPRLRSIPTKRKARVAVLVELLTWFEARRVYPEREVNEVLAAAHEDVAFLRRELVNYGYLVRESGRYSVTSEAPVRTGPVAQEVPSFEGELIAEMHRAAVKP